MVNNLRIKIIDCIEDFRNELVSEFGFGFFDGLDPVLNNIQIQNSSILFSYGQIRSDFINPYPFCSPGSDPNSGYF